MKIVFAKLRQHGMRNIFFSFLLLIFLAINSSCTPKATNDSFMKTLQENRSKWESQNITHYLMTISLPADIGNYDAMPVTIEVKDGKMISIFDVNGLKISSDVNYFSTTFMYDPDEFTIPGLFSIIEKTYKNNPPEIDVTYDPKLGYPSNITVDPYVEPCCQKYSYEVLELKILQP
jgi:hypothetical protein